MLNIVNIQILTISSNDVETTFKPFCVMVLSNQTMFESNIFLNWLFFSF